MDDKNDRHNQDNRELKRRHEELMIEYNELKDRYHTLDIELNSQLDDLSHKLDTLTLIKTDQRDQEVRFKAEKVISFIYPLDCL